MPHTPQVIVQHACIAVTHKAQSIRTAQRDRRPLHVGGAKRWNIILKRKRNAADQIVGKRNSIHGKPQEGVDRRTEHQILRRKTRVFTAVLLAGAVAVRHGDLHAPHDP